MANNKIAVFKVIEGDKEVEIVVERPNARIGQEAVLVYNKAYKTAIANGSLLKMKIDDVMKEQQLWNEEKEKEYTTISTNIIEGTAQLNAGGLKLSEARQIAINVRHYRYLLAKLLMERNQLEANTAEGYSDNCKFNFLVSKCTKYNETGKAYYKDVDDYLERSEELVALQASSALASDIYGYDPDFESKLPENAFLKEFDLIDERGRLVKNGHLVDVEGRLINEDGELVNEKDELIDENGNVLPKREVKARLPFLDDDGAPIVPGKTMPVPTEEAVPV